MYNLGLTDMYTPEQLEKARQLNELMEYFSDWPPRKYDEEDALKEAAYWGWHVKKTGDIIMLVNAAGEKMIEGKSILEAVNKMLEKSKGRQNKYPPKEIIDHANKTRNTK
jgi:hypothetical protein